LLASLDNERLLKRDRTRDVCQEMLNRPGLLDDDRRDAVRRLAAMSGQSELSIVMAAIHKLDSASEATDPARVFDLVRLLTALDAGTLADARSELATLAISARQEILRQ